MMNFLWKKRAKKNQVKVQDSGDREFAETFKSLQGNQAGMTKLVILSDQPSVPASVHEARTLNITKALKRNNIVQCLSIPGGGTSMPLKAQVGVAQFIAKSRSLEELSVSRSSANDEDAAGTSVNATNKTISTFLTAAAKNGGIRKLSSYYAGNGTSFALGNCLKANASTLEVLSLGFDSNVIVLPHISEYNTNRLTSSLANTIRSLSRLNKICLCGNEGQGFVNPILSRLINHPTLKLLTMVSYGRFDAVERAHIVKDVLLSSTRLEGLCIRVDETDTPEQSGLGEILSGMHGHETLSRLSLSVDNNMKEDYTASKCAEMLCHNQSITSLTVSCYSLVGAAQIVAALQRSSNTTVKLLHIRCRGTNCEGKNTVGSKLLADALPRASSLTSLQIDFDDSINMTDATTTIAPGILAGLTLNLTLTEIDIPLFTGHDKATLQYCATRNKFNPALTGASKEELLKLIPTIMEQHQGLSVIHDALRVRDDWHGPSN